VREQARILKDVADTPLFRWQADALFRVVQHPVIEYNAPLLRARQAADGVDQRGFTGPGDAKYRGNAARG